MPSRNRIAAGGSGSETFVTAIRFWKPMNASGSPVSSSENWSARCSTPRESWLEIVVIAGADQPDREHHRGHGGRGAERVARREPLAQPRGREHPERGDEREVQQPVRDVAVVDVAELVRDDQPHLAGREVLQQVVVEDDALGAPDAGHVRVGGGRAARGVHLVDLADVDARLARQREHRGARRPAGSGVNLLNSGSSTIGVR